MLKGAGIFKVSGLLEHRLGPTGNTPYEANIRKPIHLNNYGKVFLNVLDFNIYHENCIRGDSV